MENVSVIIPTWNREKILVRAVKSALSQSLPPFEILVCDDGSTDNTFEAVKSLNNLKIKWISGKHTGLPAVVRNRGIRKSQGEWLAFLDSDDWWEKDKLERQLKLAKKLQLKAVCSNAYVVNPQDRKKEELYFFKEKGKDFFSFNELLGTNFIICSSFLVEKRLVVECGGFPKEPIVKAIEDYALWLRISTKTKIAYVNNPLVHYFNDPDNSIRNVWLNAKLQKKTVLHNFLTWSFQYVNRDKKQIFYITKTLIEYAKNAVIL